ncbi:MAG: autotransporter-associated beta strand repeat-containing protein, partial [Maritimibacter sp.]
MLAAYLSSARPTILYRKQRIASLVALPAVIATLWACPQAAQAQEYWTGGAGTSDWGPAGNWTTAVPTASTFTFLGNNGIPATTVISANADARYLSLGTDATVDLSVTGGATTLTVSNDLGIGDASGTTASMTVTGATVNATRTFVGASGTGALTLEAGAKLTSSSVYLGFDATASGTLTVTGSGTQLTSTNTLLVGYDGTGSVALDDGARLNTWNADIGEYATGIGTVTVSNGATWTNNAYLVVGSEGTGTLAISSDGAVGSYFGSIGDIAGSTGTVTVDGSGSLFDILGGLEVGSSGTGTLTLSNGGVTSVASGAGTVDIGTYSGSTGTLNIGAAAGSTAVAAGTLNAGSVVFGDGTGLIVFNHTDTSYDFGADISGAGSLAVYSGETILTGTNSYTGGTTISGGTLIGDSSSLTGDITNNAALEFDQAGTGSFGGVISGSGSLAKSGAGNLILTGANTYTGGTTVSDGTLSVNGSVTGPLALTGGVLGGSGSVGVVNAASGSTIAPGNSIGTLSATNVNFAAGSTYTVELNDGGFVAGTNNDLINATGTVTLTGGAVSVAPVNGTDTGASYTPGTYTIITAAGGVTGTFTSVSDSFVFRDFSLGYDANNVFLTSTQVAFDAIAETPNQKAAAGSIDSLGSGHAIHDAVLGVSSTQEARDAFDAASGEGFATE